MNNNMKRKARIERAFDRLLQRAPVEKGTDGIYVIADTEDETLVKALELQQRGILCALSPELYSRHRPIRVERSS